MVAHRYRVVDVFTERPLEGNALAVFPDGAGLDDASMQKIARELNLSETTFVAPPTRADCVGRVRIFTPARELPFGGHPTVGAAWVLLDEGMVPRSRDRFALEEGVGAVAIRMETGSRPLIWLTTPPIQEGRRFDPALCALALGLDARDLLDVMPQLLDAGNPTLLVALRDRATVDRAWLDLAGLRSLKVAGDEPFCVFAFAPTPDGAYSRMFAPEYGIPEDPASGSSTGPLAAFMMRHGLVSSAAGTRFVSEQGTTMGRRSILYVEIHGDRGVKGIDVGGHVTPVAHATLTL